MKLAEVVAPNGSKIHVELKSEGDINDLKAVGYVQDIVSETSDLGTKVTDIVNGCSSIFLDSIRAIKGTLPAKASLKFGVQLGGEAGVPFVTKGDAHANFEVTLEWNIREMDKG